MTEGVVWRSRPVFVSSTFRDMHAERDHLRHIVFPALEERMEERFHHLEPIDLRWGVETISTPEQEAKELLVLKVCLAEIERSRPFLVGLLGDRYGWTPPGGRIQAAVDEAGFNTDLAGKSVTALEIEFGVLSRPEQCRRSHFYLRDPLPYSKMDPETAAQYSDAFSPDPEERARHSELIALKDRLSRTLPGRVHAYAAGWNGEERRVTGLESWGSRVLEDLWADIDQETREFAGESPASWQEAERRAIDDRLEMLCRDYQGRTDLLAELQSFALSGAATGSAWGLCLTGSPGSGKSALLARLARDLRRHEGALILTHMAGISPRSTRVDSVLRRWTEELAVSLRLPDPAPGCETAEDLEREFARLLSLASRQRRVVCLLDAVDQFERTTTATHLTWLPRAWPEDARLIVTAVPGTESTAMADRTGVQVRDLAPLTAREAGAIADALCARYHKTLPPEVRDMLLSTARADGTRASENPLWLSLSTDELLLLDEDDFARAERQFAGSGEQKLHALLLDTAGRLPAEVATLYEYLLERNERAHGLAWARSFAALIATSRAGLREGDLAALVPEEAGTHWDPLRFAALRRSFRGHLAHRGGLLQWDFVHAQMRVAVALRYLPTEAERRRLNTVIANHLESIPRSDAMRQTELMVHLIGARDSSRAARLYADMGLLPEELAGATHALAAAVAVGQNSDPNASLEWVRELLQQTGLAPDTLGHLCHRFTFDLSNGLKEARLATRLALLRSASEALGRLVSFDPASAAWQRDWAVSHSLIGDLLVAQGDSGAALEAYREGCALFDRLLSKDSDNPLLQQDASIVYGHIGEALLSQGLHEAALKADQKAMVLLVVLTHNRPTDLPLQALLADAYCRFGHAHLIAGKSAAAVQPYRDGLAILERCAALEPGNERWQAELAGCQMGLGDAVGSCGDGRAAMSAYHSALAIAERLVASDPGNARRRHLLSEAHARLGRLLVSFGDAGAAADACRQAVVVAERLTVDDPYNAEWQRALAEKHVMLGDALLAQGNGAGAATAFQQSLVVFERLVATDPANESAQRDLGVSFQRMGDACGAQRDISVALVFYEKAHAIFERLAASDLASPARQVDLAHSHDKITDGLVAAGKHREAIQSCMRACAIHERLFTSAICDAFSFLQFSRSIQRLSEMLTAQGKAPAAAEIRRNGEALIERVAASQLANLELQNAIFFSHVNTGDRLFGQQNGPAALRAFEKGLAIALRLADSDPGNRQHQRDLAACYARIGDTLLALRDISRASDVVGKAHTIFERLVATEPQDPGLQRELAASYERIGEVLLAQGDTSGAFDSAARANAIFEHLATAEPLNPEMQRSLVVSHYKMGAICQQRRDHRAEEHHIARCHQILRDMRAAGMRLDPGLAGLLSQLEQYLGH